MDLKAIEKALREAVDNNNKIKAEQEAARNAKNEEDRQRIIEGISKDLGGAFAPYLDKLKENSTLSAQELQRIIGEAVKVEVPGIDTQGIQQVLKDSFAGLKIPTPAVTVNPPKVTVPDIQMPEQMDVKGWVGLMGYEKAMLENPIPVQLRNKDGYPIDILQALASIGGRGASGGAVKINNNTNEAIPVQIVSGSSATSASNIVDSSGVAYTGSNPLPVTITSGGTATSASNIVDSSGVAYSGSNPLPITGPVVVSSITATTAAALVDSSGVAYSGSNPLPITGPVVVTSITNTTAANIVDSSGVAYEGANPFPVTIVTGTSVTVAAANVDSSGVQYSGSNPFPMTLAVGSSVTVAASLVDSTGVQYSGSNPLPITGPVVVSSITNTTASNIVDSGGVVYSGSNPFPITIVTSATATVNAAITDSGGVQYSGSNPIPVTLISGALTSTLSVGDSAARTADNGGNPVKVGGIARTTNPTAYADGDRANIGLDKLGRQLLRPLQVRELLATAYTTLSTGTETTILTAGAGTYLDCIWMAFANTSGAAVQVDIRAVSAGNIINTIEVPASGTAGWAPPVPWPQDATGNAWTADMPDITGTTVYITSLFSKEI